VLFPQRCQPHSQLIDVHSGRLADLREVTVVIE
jgi:hypothetical protein